MSSNIPLARKILEQAIEQVSQPREVRAAINQALKLMKRPPHTRRTKPVKRLPKLKTQGRTTQGRRHQNSGQRASRM